MALFSTWLVRLPAAGATLLVAGCITVNVGGPGRGELEKSVVFGKTGPEVLLVGGLARNTGFVDSLRRALEREIIVAGDPEFVGAYGAALHAMVEGPGHE